MRRITIWFVTTVAAVVLLFSYRTSTSGAVAPAPVAAGGTAPGIVSGSTPDAAGAPPSDDNSGSASGSGATPAPTSGATAKTGANLVVNGSVAQTRWGPVQVQVKISSGKIADVTALQIPNENRRDIEINSYAVPQLRAEALQAQSATIDVVSGATVTSEGYITSLQAALDSAHFKG
jgi:uncharacterized protein with FMN-binding domain